MTYFVNHIYRDTHTSNINRIIRSLVIIIAVQVKVVHESCHREMADLKTSHGSRAAVSPIELAVCLRAYIHVTQGFGDLYRGKVPSFEVTQSLQTVRLVSKLKTKNCHLILFRMGWGWGGRGDKK